MVGGPRRTNEGTAVCPTNMVLCFSVCQLQVIPLLEGIVCKNGRWLQQQYLTRKLSLRLAQAHAHHLPSRHTASLVHLSLCLKSVLVPFDGHAHGKHLGVHTKEADISFQEWSRCETDLESSCKVCRITSLSQALLASAK